MLFTPCQRTKTDGYKVLMKENKLKQLYFSHDFFADKDEKIVKMFYYFKKNINDFSDKFVRRNFFHASFGLYWEIVQYMHRNELTVDDIPMLADELRADEEFIRLIIDKFDLFRIEDNKIISDRVLKNLNEVVEKSAKSKDAAQTRWLLSAFRRAYKEIYDIEPVLVSEEIDALKRYSNIIPDLKEKIRDIIYTMKFIRFDTSFDFKQGANWLLSKNNLARIYNGEYGPLKHKKTPHELKQEQKEKELKQTEMNKPSELETLSENCSGKTEALEIIENYYSDKKLNAQSGKVLVLPVLRTLMKKFDITDKEVMEKCRI